MLAWFNTVNLKFNMIKHISISSSIEWKSLLNNCIEGEAYRSELEVKTVPTSITNKWKRLIHLKLLLRFLKDLFCNDGLGAICPLDLQLGLLIEASPPQCISNKIIKANSNSCFSLGSINQPLTSTHHKIHNMSCTLNHRDRKGLRQV